MGKVVLFGSEKGGTGKSTLATNIAGYFALKKLNFVLVDADGQKTSTTWAKDRETNTDVKEKVFTVQDSDNIRPTLLNLKKTFEYVLVDCAGRDSEELRTGMTAADVLVSPLRPSQHDLNTLPKLLSIYSGAKSFNPNLQPYLLVNVAPTNPFLKEVEQAAEALQDYPEFNLLDVVIYDRKVYRDSALVGLSVFESNNEKAKDELEKLIKMVVL